MGVLALLASGCPAALGAISARASAAGPHPRSHGVTPNTSSPRAPSAAQPTVAHEAIVGGRPAQAGTFASIAEILDFRGGEAGKCTGTVVAPTLILTAGHCAENMKTGVANGASGYRVFTGGVDEAGERQVSTVSGVIVYEGFARSVDNGDAALLVLSTATAAPALKLATPSGGGRAQAGSVATIAGWGRTHYAQRRPTEGLRWADTVVQGNRWCKRNAPPFYARSEICTIDPPSYLTGACEGDSGGPLLAPDGPDGELVQIGIAIHGYDRCSTRLPTVFTRAEAIASWVQTWVDAYAPPSSPQPSPPPLPSSP
jgi:trypsin